MEISVETPPAVAPRGLRLARALPHVKPRVVAATTLFVYLAILVPLVSISGADSFARVGGNHVAMSDRSDRISHLRSRVDIGYDGQFAYFMALDPLNARYYMDSPSYRYARVLYPTVAAATALGEPGAIPYTLIAVNLIAIVGTVWLLAAYLRRRGASTWWAAVYGFFPGLMICLYADLTEPLAYFLATAALVLLLERTRTPIAWPALLFALAALTRETTLVVMLVAALWLALQRREGRRLPTVLSSGLLVAIAVVPYFTYRSLVDRWLGVGFKQENAFSFKPFGGFTSYEFNDIHRLILFIVIVPALIWLGLAGWSARSRFDVAATLVVVNVGLFIVWLPADAYIDMRSAYRALIPIVISALLLMPRLQQRLRGDLLIGAVLSLTLVWGIVGACLALI